MFKMWHTTNEFYMVSINHDEPRDLSYYKSQVHYMVSTRGLITCMYNFHELHLVLVLVDSIHVESGKILVTLFYF